MVTLKSGWTSCASFWAPEGLRGSIGSVFGGRFIMTCSTRDMCAAHQELKALAASLSAEGLPGLAVGETATASDTADTSSTGHLIDWHWHLPKAQGGGKWRV